MLNFAAHGAADRWAVGSAGKESIYDSTGERSGCERLSYPPGGVCCGSLSFCFWGGIVNQEQFGHSSPVPAGLCAEFGTACQHGAADHDPEL